MLLRPQKQTYLKLNLQTLKINYNIIKKKEVDGQYLN